ncbi:MAG: hypothetical protein M1816_007949 [Peltula sp. TS41687]|nr:MAG: hypothetical protein M1816_007949 [Peltula sp. TS41687]
MVGRSSQRPLVPSPPSSLTVSRETSPSCSAISSGWDADDEDAMSSGETVPSRPLSVAIPEAPYYPVRPTLAEILSNTAHPPWTLSAFMAFLSQNHCLETLEFTMDASRYQRQYEEMMAPGAKTAEGREYVRMLWRRLLDAYIVPNGPREINLPGDVRDRLLSHPINGSPPSPRLLEAAVKIIYDLMDESVLVPFLNSLAPPPVVRAPVGGGYREQEMMFGDMDHRRADHSPKRGRRQHDASPPPSLAPSLSSSGSSHRTRAARGNLTLGLGRSTRSNAGGSSAGSGDNLTDDSGSPSSPGREPMTPPTTPPTSDVGGGGGVSPRGRTDRTWKKMTDKLGWRKKSSSALRDGRYGDDEGHMS